MTGRGIALVAALSTAWGTEPDQSGKLVWAELSGDPSARPKRPPTADAEALLATWLEPQDAEDLYTVELGPVPTDLLLEAKAHIDNLVREFTLVANAQAETVEPLPPAVERLVETVVHGFADARSQIKRQALASARRGEPETRLRLTLPASAADAGVRYLEALDEADAYARDARLLTLETPPVHRLFRRWYVESIVERLRCAVAGEAAPPTVTFTKRLADEVARLSPLEALADRLSRLQRLATELTAARDVDEVVHVVVRHAYAEFGALSARIYILDEDGMLRSAASEGNVAAAPQFDALALTSDLPGSLALRTGRPIFARNLAQLVESFPQLEGVYPDERTLMVAPLVVGRHQLGVLSLAFPGEAGADSETQLALLTTLADITAQALERAVAGSAVAKATERLAFLAEASMVLSSTLEYDDVLDSLADLVVPRLADMCVIHLVEEGGLRKAAIAHTAPETAALVRRRAQQHRRRLDVPFGPARVVRTGMTELHRDVSDDLLAAVAANDEHLASIRALGLTSALVVPLSGRSGTFGVITLLYAGSGRRYDAADVELAEDLAGRAALAVETAQAFHEQSGRLASVARVAEAAQHAILSSPPPHIGSVALAARYVSAAAEALVGGDLYEVVERPGAVRLLIGDVRGKGLDAVRTATVVLGEFRAAAADIDDLADVAVQIDRRVRRYLDDEDFVTALVAEIADDGTYTLANCGHPPALHVAKGSGVVTALEVPAALPLGLGAAPTLHTGRLDVGDRLLLYTDGLVEARDAERRFVDTLGLVARLGEGDLEAALDSLLGSLREAIGGPLDDDLALLLAEYRPEG